MDHDALDTLMAGRDTSMVIVTTATDTERAGCLVGFHSQCSIDPVRYDLALEGQPHLQGRHVRAVPRHSFRDHRRPGVGGTLRNHNGR